jgi:LCP family protein required for cell wall assembly
VIRRVLWPSLAGVVLLTACSVGLGGLLPGAPEPPRVIVTDAPNPSATATPFQPLPVSPSPTPTPTITATPTDTPTPADPWEDFPGPSEASATEIPRPMPRIPQSPEVVNILLLGSDERPYTGGYRTDTLMLLSLDPGSGTATLLSMPRDLYVYIPGWRMDRINTADVRGGPELTALTILYNFGLEVDHRVLVNFAGFMGAVDTLGGITVQSTGYLYDECGGRWWSYAPGRSYTMDGFQALCYARMRKATGDFDRLRRQQEVVRAFFAKVISLDGLNKVPQLYSQFITSVKTDLVLEDILPLVPLAAQLAADDTRIHQFRVDSTMADGWRVPTTGASVLLPRRAAILAMLSQAFGGPTPIAAP